MFQRIKRAICRMLGIKTRPYLTPSKLPEGPIIEPLTPSTLIHRRKPEGPPNQIIRPGDLYHSTPRSDPVYQQTWPDPFREQRPTRCDPAPRPALRIVDNPPAPAPTTPMEIVFAAGVLGAMASNDAPPLPEPEAPAPSYNSDFGCSRDYTPDDSPSSSSD